MMHVAMACRICTPSRFVAMVRSHQHACAASPARRLHVATTVHASCMDSSIAQHSLIWCLLQLDNGFTTEEIEANIVTFYQNLSDTGTGLTPVSTDSVIAFEHKDVELVALAYLDCAVALVCLAAAVAALARQRAMEQNTDVNTITIADYTIQVTGMPSSATVTEVRCSGAAAWHAGAQCTAASGAAWSQSSRAGPHGGAAQHVLCQLRPKATTDRSMHCDVRRSRRSLRSTSARWRG